MTIETQKPYKIDKVTNQPVEISSDSECSLGKATDCDFKLCNLGIIGNMYRTATKTTPTTLTIEAGKTTSIQVQDISPKFTQGNTINPGLRALQNWVTITDGAVTGEK